MIGKRLEVANKKAEKAFYKYHVMWNDNYEQNIAAGVTYPHKGAYRKTKVFCSDPFCCGNSRRQPHTINLTMQEIRIEEYEKHWEEEHDFGGVAKLDRQRTANPSTGVRVPSPPPKFRFNLM